MPFPTVPCYRSLAPALALGAIVLGLASVPARADDCSSGFTAVAQKMQNGPSAMPSFSAGIRVRARMHGFPFLGMTFNGTATYERPGNYLLALENLPRGADKLEGFIHDLFADITTSDHWSAYDVSAGCAVRGQLLVHMTPKVAGDVKSLDLVIDAVAAHVVKATFVREDGCVTIDQRFATVDGHDVIVHQDLGLAIAKAHADIAADYHDINLTTVVAGR